jgi:hypothetical protein
LDDLFFVDEVHGFVLYGCTPSMTIDGGQTWTRVAHRPLAGDKMLVRANDQLYMQYADHFLYWNNSRHEYMSFSAQGEGSSITDWSFAGNKAYAVGLPGMLLDAK